MSRFFVSCPIGFENSLADEIKKFWFEMIDLDGLPTRASFPELEIIKGGIEFEAEDHLGFQINLFSKLAGRILLRLTSFESRYFDHFEKQLSKLPLMSYVDAGSKISLQAESHKSRLNNEKSILEAATNVFKKMGFVVVDDGDFSILFRIERDKVTVSIDTSGEHLHRRGYAVYRGEAPLRETLAAYLVKRMSDHVPIDKSLTVIDPFVGSGTLLFETLSMNIPNLNRRYSWLQFKKTPKLFKSDSWMKNYRWLQAGGQPCCLGFDIDDKSIANLNQNKSEYFKVFGVNPDSLQAEVKDSREVILDRKELSGKIWLICNPPYGIRLADENAREIIESFDSQVDGIVVIHPLGWKLNMSHLKLVSSDDFKNQGLSLKLSVYTKNT